MRRGDTLWSIAARHLGPDASDAEIARAWPAWFEANRDVVGDDPDLLRPGQVLRAPQGVVVVSAGLLHVAPAEPAAAAADLARGGDPPLPAGHRRTRGPHRLHPGHPGRRLRRGLRRAVLRAAAHPARRPSRPDRVGGAHHPGPARGDDRSAAGAPGAALDQPRGLRRRGPAQRPRRPPGRRGHAPRTRPRLRVIRVRVCEPADGVAEAAVVVSDGPRVRAVAVRLVGQDGKWRVSALQVG